GSRLAATGRTRDHDEAGRLFGKSPQIRMQIAGPEVLDRGRQQAHRKRHAADGSEEVDTTARASHLERDIRRAPAQEASPAVSAQKLLTHQLYIHRPSSLAQRLKCAAHPHDERAIGFRVQIAGPKLTRLADPFLKAHVARPLESLANLEKGAICRVPRSTDEASCRPKFGQWRRPFRAYVDSTHAHDSRNASR